MIKRLINYIGEYKKDTLIVPIVMIGEVILEIFLPFLMAKIIDVGLASGDMQYVMKIGGVMLIMAILSLTCGALAGKHAAKASTGFAKNLRNELFKKVQDYSFANIDKFSTSSLITRLTTDVTNVQISFMMIIRTMVRAPLMLICATAMTFYVNSKLAVVFLFAIPVLGLGLTLIVLTVFKRFDAMFKKYDLMNRDVQEDLIGIRAVKAFVREDYQNDKFIKASDEIRDASIYAEKLIILNSPLMQAVMYGVMICIFIFGSKLIINGEMLSGDLISFITYVTQIIMSLMMLSMVLVMFVISKASVGRIFEVLDENIDIKNKSNVKNHLVKNGNISFRNVCFNYDKNSKNHVLTDINLEIKSGESVGIIGGTGSGKSTLVQLIPRLYDITEGKLLVGDIDVKDYKIENLRDAVSIVLQKNVLFSGTILENLKWGNENATEEQIIEALKNAAAYDFVMNFEGGLEYKVEQGGRNLSGGQKQRLCIARALIKNPKILIFDDSMSAVDTKTEKVILKSFKEKVKNATKIIIAQRISLVKDANKIIVMDNGMIQDIGTHEALLKTNTIYKEMYESQKNGGR